MYTKTRTDCDIRSERLLPTVHNYGSLLFSRTLVSAIGRPQLYSATSVDQLPLHFAASYMLGHSMLIPAPDVDRTGFMLIIGPNPLAGIANLREFEHRTGKSPCHYSLIF
jgi:hypothetical protein